MAGITQIYSSITVTQWGLCTWDERPGDSDLIDSEAEAPGPVQWFRGCHCQPESGTVIMIGNPGGPWLSDGPGRYRDYW